MTYNPANDSGKSFSEPKPAEALQPSPAPTSDTPGDAGNADPELLLGAAAMSDLHLSGSDPRMFPGIYTRGQRSGSFKNLSGAAEE